MVKNEITKGGSHICRYENHEPNAPQVACGDDNLIEEISNHIEKYLGPISTVVHEIISGQVHIDIHIVPPIKERNFYTLVTSGMSEKPMVINTSEEPVEIYSELMISLPPQWKMTEKDWKDENNYWPIRWLTKLAHFPHDYDTYLLDGHSIPNNDPAEPLSKNTNFIGFVIGFPKLVPDEFKYLTARDKDIIFFTLYPVYNDEMMYKLEEGSDKFFELSESQNLTELIDIRRKSILPQKSIFKKITTFLKSRKWL